MNIRSTPVKGSFVSAEPLDAVLLAMSEMSDRSLSCCVSPGSGRLCSSRTSVDRVDLLAVNVEGL